jgi:Flp pilus assembly protein TadG
MQRAIRNNSIDSRRAGTAATEFALVLPVLIIIALGTVDLGHGVHTQIALASAVREAAMYGSTKGYSEHTQDSWEAEIVERVASEMSNCTGYNAANLDVEIAVDEDSGDEPRLTVSATYQYETVIHWPGFPETIEIKDQIHTQRYR